MSRSTKNKTQKNKTSLSHRLRTLLVETLGRMSKTQKSPDELLGSLFNDVQLQKIYGDGKTFVDLIPKKRAIEITKEYELVKQDPNFRLDEFVARHFHAPVPPATGVIDHPGNMTARQHVSWLWPQLRRTVQKNRGSLFALPNSYIVPGGRFNEMFYWDSYFIMLGLAVDDDWSTIRGMIRNYIFMIDKIGYIPTANRSYFISRSQPPFFALMLQLALKKHSAIRMYTECLPALIREYSFWMKGAKKIRNGEAYSRITRLKDGLFLNRYYDNRLTPRPESLREDVETAKQSGSEKVFLDLRAAAESGWDFSSRWFKDPSDIHTIHTTDFAPVDLNCLLYIQEKTIADGYRKLLQPILASRFEKRAEIRLKTIQKYMWNGEKGFFFDYNFVEDNQSDSLTLAGLFPLFAGIATKEQAEIIANNVQKYFLKPGGLVTTLEQNGQQWDAPNGWAPLQWIAIVGFRKYGMHKIADQIKDAWLKTTEKVYDEHQKMIEKYDVVKPGKLGGGGEYTLQDGFGWTNGVYSALHDDLDLKL